MIETPVPVCVTLYHFFPHPDGVITDVTPAEDSSQQQSSSFDAAPSTAVTATTTPFISSSSSSSRWYRLPEHSKQLLRYAVQLEIIQSDGSVIYSSFQDNEGSVHPSWDLLDERFQWDTNVMEANSTPRDGSNKSVTTASDDDRSDPNSPWNETYRSLSVRITLVSSFNDTKDATTSSAPSQQKQSLPSVILAEAPLYPAFLQRLPKSSLLSVDDPTMRSTMSLQGPQQLLPISLPPNSLVVFFSDGSVRVGSALYQFLLDQHVIDESHVTTTTTVSSVEAALTLIVEDNLDRFSDDVFATLDQVKHAIATSIATAINSPSLATTMPSPSPGLNGDIARMPRSDVSLLETEDHQVADAPSEIQMVETSLSSLQMVEKEEDEEDFRPPESVVVVQDLREEQRQLQLLLEAEEQAWKQEVQALQQDKAELERLVSQSQSIQSETVQIRDATYQEVLSTQQADFALEAQRIKLIMELRTLYPIKVKSDQRYCIRGLELPRDVHSAIASEEEVSAALGYLTHLVGMMSKYLAVPLRHRLYCCSSRSAISLDGVAVFPLFTSRAVERDELDRGLRLLHRNVDCLLQTRDIRCSAQTHILGKMQRLYDKIIDGC